MEINKRVRFLEMLTRLMGAWEFKQLAASGRAARSSGGEQDEREMRFLRLACTPVSITRVEEQKMFSGITADD